MNTFADVLFEMQLRTSSLQDEAKQERWARIAASSRSGDWASGIRRVAIQLGDYAAGLRCLLKRSFASEPGATAC